MDGSRKSFPLRISETLFKELRAWAAQDMRSVNGQIEFLLHQAVADRKKRRPPTAPPRGSKPKST
jgi:hypothetical protein